MAHAQNDNNVKTLNNVVIQLRHDTAANWEESDYGIKPGEMAIADDSGIIKIGKARPEIDETKNGSAQFYYTWAELAAINGRGYGSFYDEISVVQENSNAEELLKTLETPFYITSSGGGSSESSIAYTPVSRMGLSIAATTSGEEAAIKSLTPSMYFKIDEPVEEESEEQNSEP